MVYAISKFGWTLFRHISTIVDNNNVVTFFKTKEKCGWTLWCIIILYIYLFFFSHYIPRSFNCKVNIYVNNQRYFTIFIELFSFWFESFFRYFIVLRHQNTILQHHRDWLIFTITPKITILSVLMRLHSVLILEPNSKLTRIMRTLLYILYITCSWNELFRMFHQTFHYTKQV